MTFWLQFVTPFMASTIEIQKSEGTCFSGIFFFYITLSQDEKIIRVASGKVIHILMNILWQEFLMTWGDVDVTKYRSNHLLVDSDVAFLTNSKWRHHGCQLWLTRDPKDGHP